MDILFAASEARTPSSKPAALPTWPANANYKLTGMREDFSWTRSAAAYIDLYALLLEQQHPARETPAEDLSPGLPDAVIYLQFIVFYHSRSHPLRLPGKQV